MSDASVLRDLPSPCIGVCDIDESSGFCRGCFRTRREIADWRILDHTQQKSLLGTLRERRAEHAGVAGRVSKRRAQAWADRWAAENADGQD